MRLFSSLTLATKAERSMSAFSMMMQTPTGLPEPKARAWWWWWW